MVGARGSSRRGGTGGGLVEGADELEQLIGRWSAKADPRLVEVAAGRLAALRATCELFLAAVERHAAAVPRAPPQ